MATKYLALLTNIGAAKLAKATALGTKVEITQLAVGDGNGVLPTPNPAQTALVHERRRAPLNMLTVDPANVSQIIAEQVIPEDVGGWWIREIGLFDKDGDMVAIANCAETYKPQLQEGSGRVQVIRVILIVSSTEAVTLKIDPAVVLATRQYVDSQLRAHEQSRNHPDASTTEKGFVQLSSSVTSDSESQAATPKAVKIAMDNASARLAKDRNLSDLTNTALARQNLELGDSSTRNVGTTAGTVAPGDDDRITGAMQKSQNGGDIPDVAKFLQNLGLHETGFATFTSSGRFIVPEGVTELWISAVAGGGGGGSGGGGDSSFFGGGGGSGGSGESIVKRKFIVVPGSVIDISIGAGGIGSIASTATGSVPTAGGDTVIGDLIRLHGGQPGVNAGNGQNTAPGGGYGQGFPTGSYGGDGNLNVGSGNGAPGASSPFGGGGGAGRAGTDQGTDGSSGSGYGSGGGSGGGKYGTAPITARGGNGGNGAPGIVMIEW
ncbi:phage tail protein [Citrobacter braakii]|uniref:phage tail protein n=1 Tax=Citrobacter braakii TaxID=57706 RepID=UPI00242B7236|nr:phage tail protein [Citrobacter braakii]WFW79764.1 phage tail protein [Citrobacter braakii]